MDIWHKKYNDYLKNKFGFDLYYLRSNGVWAIVQQVIQILTSLVNVFVLSRLLSKEIYGQYYFVIAIISIAGITSLPGMFSSLARAVAQGFEGNVQLIFRTRLKYSILGVVGLICSGNYFIFDGKMSLGWTLIMSGFLIPFLFSTELWWAYLIGKGKFELIAKRWSVLHLTVSLFLVSSAYFFSGQLIVLILSFLVVTSGFNLFFYWKTQQQLTNNKKSKETITYGWFMTKMKAVEIITYQIDRIIIGLISFEVLSAMTIAQRMLEIIERLIKAPIDTLFPKFAQRSITKIPMRFLIIFFLVGVVISIGFILMSKYLIILLFSEKYVEVVEIFQVLLVALPFILLSLLLKNKAEAQKLNEVLYQIHFLIPLTSMVLSIAVFFYTRNMYYFFFTKIIVLKILESMSLILHNKKLPKEIA